MIGITALLSLQSLSKISNYNDKTYFQSLMVLIVFIFYILLGLIAIIFIIKTLRDDKINTRDVIMEISLNDNITLYGYDNKILNFIKRRKYFMIKDSYGEKYVLKHTLKEIGPGKVILKFKKIKNNKLRVI